MYQHKEKVDIIIIIMIIIIINMEFDPLMVRALLILSW